MTQPRRLQGGQAATAASAGGCGRRSLPGASAGAGAAPAGDSGALGALTEAQGSGRGRAAGGASGGLPGGAAAAGRGRLHVEHDPGGDHPLSDGAARGERAALEVQLDGAGGSLGAAGGKHAGRQGRKQGSGAVVSQGAHQGERRWMGWGRSSSSSTHPAAGRRTKQQGSSSTTTDPDVCRHTKQQGAPRGSGGLWHSTMTVAAALRAYPCLQRLPTQGDQRCKEQATPPPCGVWGLGFRVGGLGLWAHLGRPKW